MTPTRLIFIPVSASLPAPLRRVDGDGMVVEEWPLSLDNAATLRPMRTVAVVPGADVLVRRLDLPAGSAAQVRAAALWMLRDELAAPADRLSVALGPVERDGGPRLVAVVSTALLDAWISYLTSLGVRSDAMVPDSLLLPEPAEGEGVALRASGADVMLRSRDRAVTVQSDLADALLEGADPVIVDDAGWQAALGRAARVLSINLLQGDERRRARSRTSWIAAGGLAAALVISPVLLEAAAGLRDASAVRALERRTLEAVVTAAPELAGNPEAIDVFIAASDGRLPQGVAAAAAALFRAVEGVEGAELDALSAESGRGLSATVSYGDFQDLARITAAVDAAGYDVRDESTVEDGGRVVSGLRIRGRQWR